MTFCTKCTNGTLYVKQFLELLPRGYVGNPIVSEAAVAPQSSRRLNDAVALRHAGAEVTLQPAATA